MGHVSYIFLDESGNFDYSTNGTRHLVLTGISMRRPFGVFGRLDNYKYDCIETGTDIECFHGHEDRWEVRRTIFDLIAAHLYDMSIDCLIVEKRKTRPEMQDSEKLYKWMLGHFLTCIVSHELNVGNSNAIVITDTIPLNKKRKAVEKAIHKAVNKNQLPGIRYRILHHQSRSHYGLQVVDYCCWAIFPQMAERGDLLVCPYPAGIA